MKGIQESKKGRSRRNR